MSAKELKIVACNMPCVLLRAHYSLHRTLETDTICCAGTGWAAQAEHHPWQRQRQACLHHQSEGANIYVHMLPHKHSLEIISRAFYWFRMRKGAANMKLLSAISLAPSNTTQASPPASEARGYRESVHPSTNDSPCIHKVLTSNGENTCSVLRSIIACHNAPALLFCMKRDPIQVACNLQGLRWMVICPPGVR